MAVTNSLRRTLTVTQHFLKNAPLTGIGGDPTEPAMSIGDWTRNFILSPPFAWRWNRATVTFNTQVGVQDYTKSAPNFGWLEKGTTNDNLAATASIQELRNQMNLAEDFSQSRPIHVAARLDDDQGNITFRLLPVPDAIYTVVITYQNASPTFVTLDDLWSPIPDYMSHLYSMGFLARSYEYWDDPRYFPAFQMFLRSLISASEGLSATEKNIYLSDFLTTVRQQAGEGIKTQLSHQARGGF